MGIRLSASQDCTTAEKNLNFHHKIEVQTDLKRKSVQNHCFLKPCDPETQFLMQVTNPNTEYLTSHSGN
jgi:hypothetical protein